MKWKFAHRHDLRLFWRQSCFRPGLIRFCLVFRRPSRRKIPRTRGQLEFLTQGE
jgi:hypothetical protein